jgi:hypothetical protein
VVAENQFLVEKLLDAGAFVNQNTEEGAWGPDLTLCVVLARASAR